MTYGEWIDMIEDHRDELVTSLRDADKSAYAAPSLQFAVYLWDDGSITVLEDTAGGNTQYSAVRDGNCVCIATQCRQWFEWTDLEDNPLSVIEERLADHPKEESAYRAWKQEQEAMLDGWNLDAWDCIRWLKDNATDTVNELEADEIAWIISETDYDDQLDAIIRRFDE